MCSERLGSIEARVQVIQFQSYNIKQNFVISKADPMLSDMNLIQEVIWSSLSLSHQKRTAVCVVVFYNIGPPVG